MRDRLWRCALEQRCVKAQRKRRWLGRVRRQRRRWRRMHHKFLKRARAAFLFAPRHACGAGKVGQRVVCTFGRVGVKQVGQEHVGQLDRRPCLGRHRHALPCPAVLVHGKHVPRVTERVSAPQRVHVRGRPSRGGATAPRGVQNQVVSRPSGVT